MRRLTSSLALVLLGGLHHTAQSQASPNLWAGTRHLVISKSKFRGDTPPKDRTTLIEPIDGGIKVTVTGTQADGTPLNFSYAAKFDGKYYPVTGSGVDSVSLRRLAPRQLATRQKTGAKLGATGTFGLSKDGRVLTLTFKDANGKPSNVLVFEK